MAIKPVQIFKKNTQRLFFINLSITCHWNFFYLQCQITQRVMLAYVKLVVKQIYIHSKLTHLHNLKQGSGLPANK